MVNKMSDEDIQLVYDNSRYLQRKKNKRLAFIDILNKIIIVKYYKKQEFDSPKDLYRIVNLLQAAHYLKIPLLVNLSLDLWFEHKNEIVEKQFAKVFDIVDEDSDLKSYRHKLVGLLAKEFSNIYESGDFIQLNLSQVKDILRHESFDKNLLNSCTSTLLLKWRSIHGNEDWIKLCHFVKYLPNHKMQLRKK